MELLSKVADFIPTTQLVQPPQSSVTSHIQSENDSNQVVVWSKSYCPYCRATKSLLASLPNVQVKIHELDIEPNGSMIQKGLRDLTGQRTVPNIFVNGQHVGGNDDLLFLHRRGRLLQLLEKKESQQRT